MNLKSKTINPLQKAIRLSLQSIAAPISIGVLALSSPAVLAAAAKVAALEEIMVTARRQSESLQDVPVSIQVVSGEEIQDLAITRPEELSKLAPGLTLRSKDNEVVLRGVRWTPGGGTAATPMYWNEISFDIGQIMPSLYDIGQVEVLRGPQGTTRGAPSISGAVTIGTRRPNFEGINGYVSGLIGEDGHWNAQGAINLPLIEDKLAVRVAATFEESEGNQVKSVNSTKDPSVELMSGRVSVLYQPTDTVSVDLMWQRLEQDTYRYQQVAGPGHAGVSFFGFPAAPANYSGPAISADDRLAVHELSNYESLAADLITLNATWDVLGHTLSYNFGSQDTNPDARYGTTVDPGNLAVGYDARSTPLDVRNEYFVHELRLSSSREDDNFIDYDIGFYSQTADGVIKFVAPAAFLPGAFGHPDGLPNPVVADSAVVRHYALTSNTDIRLETENYSVYGNLELHLSDKTELSVGLRRIHDERPSNISTTLSPAVAAVTNPTGGFFSCDDPLLGATDSPYYAGVCDFPAALPAVPDESYVKTFETNIWNASLSHQFTDDLLAYVTAGTSWRAGLPAINNPGLPSDKVFPAPEEATSYEIGIKSMWGETVRVNAALFQIDYENQISQFQGVSYWNNVGMNISQTSIAFFDNVNAQVRGIELEVAAQPLENLSLGMNASYAKIESDGGNVPCNDPSRPINAANPINSCPSAAGEVVNNAPQLQANLTAAYTVPLGELDGYVRLLANHQGSNPNFGTSREKTSAYTIVDLYAGVMKTDGGWDIGFYGKNIFDKTVELSRNVLLGGALGDYFGATGYDTVSVNAPRELGISARYSF